MDGEADSSAEMLMFHFANAKEISNYKMAENKST